MVALYNILRKYVNYYFGYTYVYFVICHHYDTFPTLKLLKAILCWTVSKFLQDGL